MRPPEPNAEVAARLLAWFDAAASASPCPALGVSGPQGSGKSTVCAMLERDRPGVVVLGLDDFYLTKAARADLASEFSPLFSTRGPPGTHDLALLNATLDALQNFTAPVSLPRFSKRDDDRSSETILITAPPRAIVLEGWCVGATLPDDFSSAGPLNAVEARDTDSAWRAHQAAQLAGPYAALWDRIAAFAHFVAPSFEAVLAWRLQQEAGNLGAAVSPERAAWVANFIQHYERITRAMAAGARRPGLVIALDHQRRLI